MSSFFFSCFSVCFFFCLYSSHLACSTSCSVFLLLKYYQHTQNPVILSPQLGLVLKLKHLVTNQFSVKELVFSKPDLSNSKSKTGHSPVAKTKAVRDPDKSCKLRILFENALLIFLIF